MDKKTHKLLIKTLKEVKEEHEKIRNDKNFSQKAKLNPFLKRHVEKRIKNFEYLLEQLE